LPISGPGCIGNDIFEINVSTNIDNISNYVFGSSNFVAAILKMVHRNTRNMWTMPNTGETGKSVETLRFAEMLSSFAQIPGDVDSAAWQ
ncbi:hypothetical protein Q5W10_13160, partial [Waltera intestinalis]